MTYNSIGTLESIVKLVLAVLRRLDRAKITQIFTTGKLPEKVEEEIKYEDIIAILSSLTELGMDIAGRLNKTDIMKMLGTLSVSLDTSLEALIALTLDKYSYREAGKPEETVAGYQKLALATYDFSYALLGGFGLLRSASNVYYSIKYGINPYKS